ncbi:CapA family protein [Parapedobacter soli]|uniref:CapA family protein n=1 Tax=Parapedobacter soli TaxID=416955 RepID=UPI0021CA37C0|nr:CapA family protein [Parapedobacter soli]
MKILIAGDLVIPESVGSENLLADDVKGLFQTSDYNILNLECTVTDAGIESQIIKTGPHLKGNEYLIKSVLRDLKINLVTLANNHILDYGAKGLVDTIEFCKTQGVEFVGAGRTLHEAQRPTRVIIDGIRISIVNFAENEWASSTEQTAGANPMDIVENVRVIKKEKKNSDFVFVIIHGGHEYYNLPSPRIQKQYRFYVDNGADLIVGHHPHCISGHEIYNGVPIYYSLGNFLFAKEKNTNGWYLGIVLALNISNNGTIETQAIPVQLDRTSFILKTLPDDEEKAFNNDFQKFNEIIGNKEKLEKSWEEYVSSRTYQFLNNWSPASFIKNRYIYGLMNKLGFSRFLMNEHYTKAKLNLIRCEAHADLSKKILKKHLSSNEIDKISNPS